ncbi:chromatin assembly factor 1 subunit A isoform X2 [Monodelphis domestica]|uniref:Chromatin assembly factor 1 subunit A n=1 Tax=Monodelphis domestica TaxID=13616 RepID=F7F7P0_MONDO|nr:chromatin assembly factor 1 subunit A isoform X2 [Monodelphis domestica]
MAGSPRFPPNTRSGGWSSGAGGRAGGRASSSRRAGPASPPLCRRRHHLRGACVRVSATTAGAMLEEPESPALGLRGVVTAMECKDRPAFPTKKLVQARLPFKRLIPIPKEKTDNHSDNKKSGSQSASIESKVSDLETSLENLETDCQLNSGMEFTSKLVNGKGPLDNFLTRKVKNQIGQPLVIIDLTEDSNDRLGSPMEHSKLNSEAFSSRETINGIREKDKGLMGPSNSIQNHKMDGSEETSSEDSSATHQNDGSGILKDEGSKKGSLKSFPELIHLQKMDSENKQDSWSEVKGILCRGKVPVVVLQDILAVKSLPVSSLNESITSESGVQVLCPEDDSVLSHSSLSSPSSTSSPEGPSVSEKKRVNISPLTSTTPVHKVPRKLIKNSAEKGKMRLQRDKERLDKQLKLQAEKEEKEKLKEEAKRAKEEAKKKKEEEKELKEKERREKREKDEKEKAEKLRLKEEKRKERQEALEAKLEEKRKKEEEKRLKEEEKRIKAEKAEITRFFQKPKTPQAPKTLAGSCGKFAPFEIKENMVLAPLCRVVFDQDLSDQLDQLLKDQNSELNFLKDLKCREPHKSGPTLPYTRGPNTINSDVVIVESGKVSDVPERKKFGRMKLLQFSENHRPAYWGTWNKKTPAIRPRNPWSKDSKLLDYEIDSDEEWEEEEPGESLSHSEGDDDEDGGEDEDEDDGFFVPHGYLSEDEGVTEEGADPENNKVRQKLKAKEWDELLAKGKRFRVLQPVKIGCIWEDEKNSNASSELKVLQQFAACILDTVIPEEEHTPKANKREKRDRQILEQLLPLLHGNVNGSKVIIQEFQECYRQGLFSKGTSSPDSGTASPTSPSTSRPQTPTANEDVAIPSKARLKRIISENSVYEKRPDFRMCWYVHLEVLKSFDQEHLPVPCQWNYITQVPSATREDNGNGLSLGPTQTTPVSLKRKNTGSMSITYFMKKPRHDEQVETVEMDGFQADTEEEEEDDTDCMIIDIPINREAKSPCGLDSKFDDGAMEMEPSEDPQPVSVSNRT